MRKKQAIAKLTEIFKQVYPRGRPRVFAGVCREGACHLYVSSTLGGRPSPLSLSLLFLSTDYQPAPVHRTWGEAFGAALRTLYAQADRRHTPVFEAVVTRSCRRLPPDLLLPPRQLRDNTRKHA